MKKPFHYADHGDSFVIEDTRLPKYWYNYFWSNQGYIASVSHVGHGESYYIDDKANMCRLNAREARYLYLRDDDTKTCWNVGEGPLLEPVSGYSCKHHISHSCIASEKDGIKASLRTFVPIDGYWEIWTLKLANVSPQPRKLSLFSAVNFELEGFPYDHYTEVFRTMDAFFDGGLNGVFCSTKHPSAPHPRYNGFLSCSEKVFAADCDLLDFLGAVGSFQRPLTILDGRDCRNTRRACYDVGGVLQNKLVLAPGEEKTIHFVYGVAESLAEAASVTAKFAAAGAVEREFEETQARLLERYSRLTVQSSDGKVNDMMNKWAQKQLDFCIVGKKGVRDNAQISSGLLMFRPDKARDEILEILRHQFKAGHALSLWYPYNDTRYSDQAFWIIWMVTELIKETGDFKVLDQVIEYEDEGEDSVLNHMKAAVNRLLDDRGENGLVRIYYADWNDALNVKDDPDAESVMLTQQFCLAMKEMMVLCEKIGDSDYRRYLQEKYDEVRAAVNAKAWNGEWYARVLSKKGTIGSKGSPGSQIYLNSQVWGVLADVPEPAMLPSLFKAIDGMEHDFGFPINLPPYRDYLPHVGRMSIMLAGLYENGGVYCHASAFKIMMDAKMGRAEEAFRTLKKIMPDSELNPYTQSKTEPYVFTNCYALHPDCYGKSDRSWITGTVSWCMKGMYEGILGIVKDYDGLRIAPCLPAHWEKVRVTRRFRGATYDIVIEKAKGAANTSVSLTVDGNPVDGQILPVFSDHATHQVRVKVG